MQLSDPINTALASEIKNNVNCQSAPKFLQVIIIDPLLKLGEDRTELTKTGYDPFTSKFTRIASHSKRVS